MAIVRCSRNHYYDNEKFCECPHCAKNNEAGDMADESVTVAVRSELREDYAVKYVSQKNLEQEQKQKINVREREGRNVSFSETDRFNEERTVSIYEKRGISGYAAGWLVCVEGEDYGQNFPLYAGFNRIGRSGSSDIVLKDRLVSREEHCSVIYEEKKNVFYVSPSAGSLTYLDEELVEQAQQIKSGQILMLGESRLEFIAFCIGEKRWKERG